jgi:hypothetical protein
MDWSWWYTELATTVTGSEPIILPCVGLHESCGVCRQGEHERTTPMNLSAAVFRKVTRSLVTGVRKCIQADGGHFEQLALVLNGESVTIHLTFLNKFTMLLSFLIYLL